MERRPIRIAVASDIHAYSDRSESPSHLDIAAPEGITLQHPIAALLHLIREQSLVADFLLSPGDLGDKADAKGVAYAWHALERLSRALNCRLFTATAGNHDLDSRLKTSDHDPEHILKGLTPSFPLQDETLDDRFWSRAYVIKDEPPLRLVLLNSSAYHGIGDIEQNHGRVSDTTLSRLRSDLSTLPQQLINVLLCHHHPHQHSELSLGEGDVMKQGQRLLDMLGEGTLGRWLVIHGHKHHPKIAYAAGGSTSPVVFAAGSLCAILTGPLQTAARNQFYILELDPTECETFGMVGRVRAWDWYPGQGWLEATPQASGLPAEFGFGIRVEPQMLARSIARLAANSSAPIPWGDLVAQVPELAFLLPNDLQQVKRVLAKQHGFHIGMNGTKFIDIGRLSC